MVLLLNYLDGYNKYVQVIGYSIGAGACANNKREGTLLQIQDDTKLMHFLSTLTDAKDQWEGSDLLRVVIEDIVSSHCCVMIMRMTMGKLFNRCLSYFNRSSSTTAFFRPFSMWVALQSALTGKFILKSIANMNWMSSIQQK